MTTRTHAVLAHLCPQPAANMSNSTCSRSMFAHVEAAPIDPIFGPQNAYLADPSPLKVNLVVGAYRTDEGKPWILPVVKKAEERLHKTTTDHEYLPIDGLKDFTNGAAKLLFGPDSTALRANRVLSAQSLSGSGALRLGADFLSKFFPGRTVLIPDPTWANHRNVFSDAHLNVATYRYFNPATIGLDFDGMLADMRAAPAQSIVLLHVCAHNPTGIDPTRDQWEKILDVIKEKQHITFFDTAYQGFATGDLEGDAFSVRLFERHGVELLVAQSFAKNMGMYGERIGCLHIVLSDPSCAENVRGQLKRLIRGSISNPPAYGARVTSMVLNDPELFNDWLLDIKTMANRIKLMRQALFDGLIELKTPGTWNHILSQIGMFTFTGLSEKQCEALSENHHIYLTKNGRISIAGLNTRNVLYVAKAIDDVVRNY